MAFVKLDTNILNSTLWIERDQREVFITALLMAEPCQFKEPQQQIEVDSLKTTGFFAPAGWYGFVQAAGIGIVNRAGVPREDGMEALRKLCAPEVESRSQEFDGRRMIRINGGYLILNFMKYRDKDHTAADRQRKLRERRKEEAQRNSQAGRYEESRRYDTLPQRNITEADSRGQSTDAEKEQKPTAKKKPSRVRGWNQRADGRRELFRGALDAYWKHMNRDVPEMPWSHEENAVLEKLLVASPSMTLEQFQMCLNNRAHSEGVTHGERVYLWLANVTKFKDKINSYKQPVGTGGKNATLPVGKTEKNLGVLTELLGRRQREQTAGQDGAAETGDMGQSGDAGPVHTIDSRIERPPSLPSGDGGDLRKQKNGGGNGAPIPW